MDLYAVIMAGGSGTRFWPRSRKKTPKQLLNIVGEKTMIQETMSRLDGIVQPDRIYIVTNEVQRDTIVEQLPEVPSENVIAEPMARNTAPCIGLSAVMIKAQHSDAVIITLPADHRITEIQGFKDNLLTAAQFAVEKGGLVTIGIEPTRPDTGYGYVKIETSETSKDIHRVIEFKEKPDLETAKSYMESGNYLWNSGMFVWRVDAILEEIHHFLPETYSELIKLEPVINTDSFYSVLKDVYGSIEGISIDFGVMEQSKKVYLVQSSFSWSDVGSWETVYELSNKDEHDNAVNGDVYLEDVKGSYVYSPDTYVALIGVEDLVVVKTEDALLVCSRDRVQDVKNVVTQLQTDKKNSLL